MLKINFEKIVNADRAKVFDIFTNFEKFQIILPKFFPSVRIRSTRGNIAVVEEHIRIADHELVMMTKHVTQYPEVHEVFVIGGDARGSHIVERYESIQGGTKITVNAELKLGAILKITGFFKKYKIKQDFIKLIDEFTRIAEN